MPPASNATPPELLAPEHGDHAPLEGEQLRQALKKQLEYYFSKENLEKDDYLKSCMDAELYVPIEVVAGFNMVRSLCSDVDLIKEVLKESKEVTVDEAGEKVRPLIKTQRSTLILRDITPDTPLQEIEELFQNPGCATFKSARPDFGNTWFVAFETEKEAISTLLALRSLTFKGQPVQARVKSENPLKALLSSHNSSSLPADQKKGQNPYSTPTWTSFYDALLGGPPNGAPRSGPGSRHRQGSRQHGEHRRSSSPGSSAPVSSAPSPTPSSTPRTGRRAASDDGPRSRDETRIRRSGSAEDSEALAEGQQPRRPRTHNPKRGTSHGSKPAPKEGQTRAGPGSAQLGPEYFPPLPGAGARAADLALPLLNYSAVANAVADKPAPPKSVRTKPLQPNGVHESKSTPSLPEAPQATAAKENGVPPKVKDSAPAKEAVPPKEAAPAKEATPAPAKEISPEQRQEDAKASAKSYAEILRMKALKEKAEKAEKENIANGSTLPTKGAQAQADPSAAKVLQKHPKEEGSGVAATSPSA